MCRWWFRVGVVVGVGLSVVAVALFVTDLARAATGYEHASLLPPPVLAVQPRR